MSLVEEGEETGGLRIPPRPADQVMRLRRMGSAFPTRLSFMRSLTRRMSGEGWRFEKKRFELDENGFGTSVFSADTGKRVYSLIIFTSDLPPEKRTDRVIAEAWDATFTLFDGEPAEADIERLSQNVPKQEAGRCLASELVLGRANKSLRLFAHVVERLAAGEQPDSEQIRQVGYLMRTTAVYGNGKFGISDRRHISDRDEVRGSFQVEMIAVYLFRWFTLEMVDHVAKARGGASATGLAPELRRYLGVGNSTGLGMAPFLIGHPGLVNRWVSSKETALAQVRSLASADDGATGRFLGLLDRAISHIGEWEVEDEEQMARIRKLRHELPQLRQWVEERGDPGREPWDRIYRFAEAELSVEGQELVVSLLIDTHGALVDALADHMFDDETPSFDATMTIDSLQRLIDRGYGWALSADPGEGSRYWYYSEEKLEPRFGERPEALEPRYEMPVTVLQDVQNLYSTLQGEDAAQSLAEFLMRCPEYRYLVQRIQTAVDLPYAEIHDSLIGSDVRPLDLLRFKLAFFGASKFDPKSDLWTRINLYQGAPLPKQLEGANVEDWAFPTFSRQAFSGKTG